MVKGNIYTQLFNHLVIGDIKATSKKKNSGIRDFVPIGIIWSAPPPRLLGTPLRFFSRVFIWIITLFSHHLEGVLATYDDAVIQWQIID